MWTIRAPSHSGEPDVGSWPTATAAAAAARQGYYCHSNPLLRGGREGSEDEGEIVGSARKGTRSQKVAGNVGSEERLKLMTVGKNKGGRE